MTNWIKNRLAERTSLDGLAIIAVSLVVLVLGPLADLAAYAGLVHGAWTIWKAE